VEKKGDKYVRHEGGEPASGKITTNFGCTLGFVKACWGPVPDFALWTKRVMDFPGRAGKNNKSEKRRAVAASEGETHY